MTTTPEFLTPHLLHPLIEGKSHSLQRFTPVGISLRQSGGTTPLIDSAEESSTLGATSVKTVGAGAESDAGFAVLYRRDEAEATQRH